MIKKVVLDKADRLFHFPFDLEDSLPRRTIKAGEKKLSTIDLARLRWPVESIPESGEAIDYSSAGEDDIEEPLRRLLGRCSLRIGLRHGHAGRGDQAQRYDDHSEIAAYP